MDTPAAKDRQGSVASSLPEGKYGDIVRYGTSRGYCGLADFATPAIGQRWRRGMRDVRFARESGRSPQSAFPR